MQCPQCDHPASPEAVSSGVCERCGGALAAVPAIDISQLARLDELTDAPRAGSAQPAKARDPFAPPAAEPSPASRFAPPPGAFGPAGDSDAQDEQELAVERSTRAIRIANRLGQEPVGRSAAHPPAAQSPAAKPAAAPRTPAPAGIAAAGVQLRGIAIVIAVVLVLAIIVVALVIQRS